MAGAEDGADSNILEKLLPQDVGKDPWKSIVIFPLPIALICRKSKSMASEQEKRVWFSLVPILVFLFLWVKLHPGWASIGLEVCAKDRSCQLREGFIFTSEQKEVP